MGSGIINKSPHFKLDQNRLLESVWAVAFVGARDKFVNECGIPDDIASDKALLHANNVSYEAMLAVMKAK